MPKYGTHKIVLDEVITRLIEANHPFKDLLAEHIGAAELGAIGPDLLFFSEEYEPFNFIMEVAKKIKGIKDFLAKLEEPFVWFKDNVATYLSPITQQQKINEAMGWDDSECYTYINMLSEMNDNIGSLKNEIKNFLIFDAIAEGVDIIDNVEGVPNFINWIFNYYFQPSLQENKKVDKWYWFDTLHYRKTGEFAKKLWEIANASGSDIQKAYALGYLTHIATDVIGHAYVNTVVGGPYRTHVWRHVTVENYMDSWVYNEYKGENACCDISSDMSLSGLYDYEGECFNANGMEIAELLAAALDQTYPHDPDNPNDFKEPLTAAQLSNTFGSFMMCFEWLYSECIDPPEIPNIDFYEDIEELVQNLRDALPSDPTDGCSLGDVLSGNCDLDLNKFLRFIVDVIKWGFESVLALLNYLTNLLCEATMGGVAAALYYIQDFLYGIWLNLRRVLVLSGILMPYPEEISEAEELNLVRAGQCLDSSLYPRQMVSGDDISNLEYPDTDVEAPAVEVYCTDKELTPRAFISDAAKGYGAETINSEAWASYAGSDSPETTLALYQSSIYDWPWEIGNAASLAFHMVANIDNETKASQVFCNWNLDSDRGYAQKTWVGTVYDDAVAELAYESDEDYLP